MPHRLKAANIILLEQGKDLLQDISDEMFLRAKPPFYKSGIGRHFRHILDHYKSVLDEFRSQHGISNRERDASPSAKSGLKVDYDARSRDLNLEEDRELTIDVIDEIIQDLEGLSTKDMSSALKTKMDCGDGQSPNALWTRSSLGRELQFMQSHTTHHYALIAMILRDQGYEPPSRFGIASSTLLHENKACAPAG